MRFVLASASPARLAVLKAAGIDATAVVSGVDEDAVTAALHEPSPTELVRMLAEAKADAVAETMSRTTGTEDGVVVGCDSMLHIGGEVLGKPKQPDVALRRWEQMAGKAGELVTGHAVVVISGGAVTARTAGTASTTVRFAEPTDAELRAYIDSGEPLEVAGAFTLDGLGGWFVDGIDGDPSTVIGISLPLTRRLLGEVGLSVLDFWPAR